MWNIFVPGCVVYLAHPSMTTQSPYSQVNTYVVSTDTVNSSTSVYKTSAVSMAVTGAASFHASSMNQYPSSYSTYPGVDGAASGHTTAATQYPSYAGSAAPGFAPQPQMGGTTGGYGTVQSSQPVYGGSAHLNASSKPYTAVSTTASDKQQTGMTSYQTGGLSQSYDVYHQLNSAQLASAGVTSSASGYPLSGTAYQTGQLTYQGSSYQPSPVQAGYELSGSTSYGTGHQYAQNPYSRQTRDSSMQAGSYTSGPDGSSVSGYPRGTQTYSGTVPPSAAPAQSVSSTANKLVDSLGKLSVKDTTSVTVSGQFDGTSSSASSATLSATTTTASSACVGFLSATAAATTARTTSSVLSTKSSAPLTSKSSLMYSHNILALVFAHYCIRYVVMQLYKIFVASNDVHIHCESKKGRHYTLVHIFAKYRPIFIILSPTYSVGNLQ